jgi:transposase
MRYTINQFRKDYPTEDVCLDKIFELRYSAVPCCPQCSQQTTFKRIVGRRSYQCSDKDCQYQLYPTAGTVFEKTRTSLVDWFYVIYLMSSTRNGVSAKEIERQLGVTYKCAWRLGHQVRLLMAQGGLSMLSGTVETDEWYYGGQQKNKHKKEREKLKKGALVNKVPVVAMLERGGNIIVKVMDEATGLTIKPVINENVEQGSLIITDGFGAYYGLNKGYTHEIVNHTQDEFVRGTFHTNTVEGFFSHLSRTITGTHIAVSKKHLQKYVDECAFRYVHRNEGQMMFHTILNQTVNGNI